MADIIIHLFVPMIILLALFDKEYRRYILMLFPLAVISDLDIFYEHRALLHNIFIPVGLFVLACLTIEKHKKSIFIFSGLYFLSHIILDLFNGGVKVFYPFYDGLLRASFEIVVKTFNPLNYFYIIKLEFIDGIDVYYWRDTTVISSGGFGIGFLILTFYLINLFLKRYNIL